jgi:hypothetical protein
MTGRPAMHPATLRAAVLCARLTLAALLAFAFAFGWL